jgi:hypothetical protein
MPNEDPSNGMRWQTVTGIVSIVVVISIAAAGIVVQFGALSQQIVDLQSANHEINDRVRANEERIAALGSSAVSINMSLKEVETQFCASDIVRNLMHANDLREVSLLWQKIFGTPYPTDNAYYPSICNRHDGDNK